MAVLMPWVWVVIFCAAATWVSIGLLDVQAVIAPVLKLLALGKSLLLKTLPAVTAAVWYLFGSKLVALLTELAGLLKSLLLPVIVTVTAGWKAWSAKKLVRTASRVAASLSARFIATNLAVNLLFGYERKQLKTLPIELRERLMQSRLGGLVSVWQATTPRRRRLLSGFILCVLLTAAGQWMIGMSILLFDLLWEVVLWLWRSLVLLWRLLNPIVWRFLPNAIGNFFSQRLVPFLARAIPVVRDDYRVLYVRFSLRRHLRALKYRLYRFSRSRRPMVRRQLQQHVPQQLRQQKHRLLGRPDQRQSG